MKPLPASELMTPLERSCRNSSSKLKAFASMRRACDDAVDPMRRASNVVSLPVFHGRKISTEEMARLCGLRYEGGKIHSD